MVGSCVRAGSRLLLSAVLTVALFPVTASFAQSGPPGAVEIPTEPMPAEAPPADSDSASDTSSGDDTSTSSSSSTEASAEVKRLHTIPEDGMGNDAWYSAATRIVRDLTAKRPGEDLVICIAGCNPKLDRVVYAQLTDVEAKKPAATTAEPGAATPSTSSTPLTGAPAADGGAKAPASQPETKPAIANAAAATANGGQPKAEFLPAMAQPKLESVPAAGAAPAKTDAKPVEAATPAASPKQ